MTKEQEDAIVAAYIVLEDDPQVRAITINGVWTLAHKQDSSITYSMVKAWWDKFTSQNRDDDDA